MGLIFLFMISVWNVRGMYASTKQRDVVNFVHSNKVILMGFVETKLSTNSLHTCYRKFFSSWKIIDNSDLHPRGCIWIIWREAEFDILQIRRDSCYIHLGVMCKKLHQRFDLTVVYVPNDLHARLELCEKLVQLMQIISGPWLLLGDFNNELEVSERIGGLAPGTSESWPFQQCLADCVVEDMRSNGRVFTWTNGTIWSKIDHGLINSEWMHEFPAVEAFFGAPRLSDHTPNLVNLDVQVRRPCTQFKFLKIWALH